MTTLLYIFISNYSDLLFLIFLTADICIERGYGYFFNNELLFLKCCSICGIIVHFVILVIKNKLYSETCT